MPAQGIQSFSGGPETLRNVGHRSVKRFPDARGGRMKTERQKMLDGEAYDP